MTNRFDLSTAKTSYAVANAPLFLLQRLRDDPVTLLIATEKLPATIFESLKASLKKKPKDLDDLVLPYVYLTALASTQNLRLLRRAATLRAPYSKWLSYLANILVLESKPTVSVTLPMKGLAADGISKKSATPTLQQKFN